MIFFRKQLLSQNTIEFLCTNGDGVLYEIGVKESVQNSNTIRRTTSADVTHSANKATLRLLNLLIRRIQLQGIEAVVLLKPSNKQTHTHYSTITQLITANMIMDLTHWQSKPYFWLGEGNDKGGHLNHIGRQAYTKKIITILYDKN